MHLRCQGCVSGELAKMVLMYLQHVSGELSRILLRYEFAYHPTPQIGDNTISLVLTRYSCWELLVLLQVSSGTSRVPEPRHGPPLSRALGCLALSLLLC